MLELPRPYRAHDAHSAVLDNQAAYWLYRARIAGWAYGTADGLTWYRSGQPSAERNAIVRAHILLGGDPSALIAAARERVSPDDLVGSSGSHRGATAGGRTAPQLPGYWHGG